MPLSAEQQQRIIQHLTSRVSSPKCPVCRATNMRVQRYLASLPIYDPAHNQMDQVAVVNIMCEYCGYVMSFSADKIGVNNGEGDAE